VHTDQYHFMRLETARQAKNEGPQEFADRCRALAQKVMCKESDPVAQRIHRENAERMILASFVAGLSGVAGRQDFATCFIHCALSQRGGKARKI